jgi:hypothetical protein
LAGRGLFSSLRTVIGFLRFVAVINASVWFGSTLFFTLVASPALFSPEMKQLLRGAFEVYADPIALILLGRYYVLQQVCAGIALLHLLMEWLYTGRALPRAIIYTLMGMLAVALIGGHAVQPKMVQWHVVKHARGYTPEQRKRAQDAFGILRGFVHITNVLMAVGLLVYVWRVAAPPDVPRFNSRAKFRG